MTLLDCGFSSFFLNFYAPYLSYDLRQLLIGDTCWPIPNCWLCDV